MTTTARTIKSNLWGVPTVQRIAERMATEPQPFIDPHTVFAFHNFIDNTYVREFTTAQGAAWPLGITRGVTYVNYQPYSSKGYPSLREMRRETLQSGVLLISTEGADYWFLGRDRNLRFRAIHDLHHLAENANFSVDGETLAALRFIRLTDNLIFRELLFSEIIGQRCYYEVFGTYMEEQKVLLGWARELSLLVGYDRKA